MPISLHTKNSMHLEKKTNLACWKEKTEMNFSNNCCTHKYIWIWWNQTFVWFLPKWFLPLFSIIFVMRRWENMIASVLTKKNIPQSFVFFLLESVFPIGLAFSSNRTKKCTGVFLQDISGKNGCSQENSGGQPQLSLKFLQKRRISVS